MSTLAERLESPARTAQLAPVETLCFMGLAPGHVFCDIGAGTGLFAFAARTITDRVHALDVDDAMLEIMREKAVEQNIDDIRITKTSASSLDMPEASCDAAMMCAVLHELGETSPSLLAEAVRILKKGGILGIIELRNVPVEPERPIGRRITENDMIACAEGVGLKLIRTRQLGHLFYMQVYKNE